MFRHPSPTPPFNDGANDGASEFPEFSTQMTLGGMTAGDEATPNEEDSTPTSRRSHLPAWNTDQNLALREQPRYCSQAGGSVGSRSSESKRSRESDACGSTSAGGSTSIGSIPRPIGRDASKKKGKKKSPTAALEVMQNDWAGYKQAKQDEVEQLKHLAAITEEANRLRKEETVAKKMKLYLKLSDEEHLSDHKKEMLKRLSEELFGN
ncbi:uncharacterized protein LOC130721926 [Lotus japonicus]|uniref:uncharacterized protein LOC130721926 n=1 Tax=Lotus japonicus TaxID=34305 RepID=UPI002587F831|nr:uncharacterized protein LOC130721926 [Lotus japonicus]